MKTVLSAKSSIIKLVFALAFIGCGSGCGDIWSQHPALIGNDAPAGSAPSDEIELFPDGSPLIYRDFGPLIVSEGEWESESSHKPWSAYWLPIRDKWLFSGEGKELGPLQKYDAYVRATRGHESAAAAYEERELYDPKAATWEGHCHAWALASLLYPEPKESVSIAGITFTVADLKALLIKSYERSFLTYYGTSFTDPIGTAWASLPPHLFHRFVEAQLRDRKKPFVMNKVPASEVWNIPVWKFWTNIHRDEVKPEVFHVRSVAVAAAVLDKPYDTENREEAMVYTYDLVTAKDANGREIAINGFWTGMSQDVHPSVLIAIPDVKIPRWSRNPEVRSEWIDEILALRRP